MEPELTRSEARDWMGRWQIVNENERLELRNTTIETKLHQLAAMMAMAEGLGWDTSTDAEIHVVRDRWARLKRIMRETG